MIGGEEGNGKRDQSPVRKTKRYNSVFAFCRRDDAPPMIFNTQRAAIEHGREAYPQFTVQKEEAKPYRWLFFCGQTFYYVCWCPLYGEYAKEYFTLSYNDHPVAVFDSRERAIGFGLAKYPSYKFEQGCFAHIRDEHEEGTESGLELIETWMT